MQTSSIWPVLAAVLILSLPSAVFAAADVPVAYRTVATAHGIPPRVFYAIALTESGRAQAPGTKLHPWPWSANFAGRGRFFDSRGEAWQAIVEFINSGHQSVDVGLMQINWRYHHKQLRTIWQALDPHRNLVIAANILLACYQRSGDWWESVGCYHAPSDAERASAYRYRVRRHWRTLIS